MICVSISEPCFERIINIVKSEDLVEVRFENTNFSDDELKKIFSAGANIIATYRAPDIGESKRFDLFEKAIRFGAKYIDLELELSDSFKEKLTAIGRKNGVKSIVSYHDYQKTPSRRELEEIVKWCHSSGGDIAKIACVVQNSKDIARLLALYASDKEVISIGMGDLGRIIRVIAPFLGAPFTYASIADHKKTAAGQFSKNDLQKYLELLKNV